MKYILIILICFFSLAGYSQAIQNRANALVTVQDQRLRAPMNLFIPVYNDTTQALSGTNEGIDSTGAIIYTRNDTSFWIRACCPKFWKRLGGGSIGTPGAPLNSIQFNFNDDFKGDESLLYEPYTNGNLTLTNTGKTILHGEEPVYISSATASNKSNLYFDSLGRTSPQRFGYPIGINDSGEVVKIYSAPQPDTTYTGVIDVIVDSAANSICVLFSDSSTICYPLGAGVTIVGDSLICFPSGDTSLCYTLNHDTVVIAGGIDSVTVNGPTLCWYPHDIAPNPICIAIDNAGGVADIILNSDSTEYVAVDLGNNILFSFPTLLRNLYAGSGIYISDTTISGDEYTAIYNTSGEVITLYTGDGTVLNDRNVALAGKITFYPADLVIDAGLYISANDNESLLGSVDKTYGFISVINQDDSSILLGGRAVEVRSDFYVRNNTRFEGNGGSTTGFVPTATDNNGNWTWQAAAGGLSLFPTVDTGTATGNVTGDLDGNTLSIMNGNVGIGTATPGFPLDVNGRIHGVELTIEGGAYSSISSSDSIEIGDVNSGNTLIKVAGSAGSDAIFYKAVNVHDFLGPVNVHGDWSGGDDASSNFRWGQDQFNEADNSAVFGRGDSIKGVGSFSENGFIWGQSGTIDNAINCALFTSGATVNESNSFNVIINKIRLRGGEITLDGSTVDVENGELTLGNTIIKDSGWAAGNVYTATSGGSVTLRPPSAAVGNITGLGTGVATWLATPSSANLLAALTTKTGTGNAVFSISPTLTGITDVDSVHVNNYLYWGTSRIGTSPINFDPTNTSSGGGINFGTSHNFYRNAANQTTLTGTLFNTPGITMTTGSALTNGNRGALDATADGVWRIYNNAATGFNRLCLGLATSSFPAWSRNGATAEAVLGDNSGFAATQSLYDRFGSGSPESVVTAPVGAVYHRTDGGAGTSFYVKESGSGNTGWIAK